MYFKYVYTYSQNIVFFRMKFSQFQTENRANKSIIKQINRQMWGERPIPYLNG